MPILVHILAHVFVLQSKEEGKYQESIQSSTTPDQVHHMGKSQNRRKHHTQASQEASNFPAGDNRAAMKR